MITSTKTRLGLAAGLMLGTALPAAAQSDSLTLCWAAWDPANALVELSKDFTAESGIAMNFEFVPWPNFTDRILNELNAGGELCDLLIGDSQWLGGSAENGYYVKLNDFFEAEGISMDDFAPATVYAYSTWPKGTPNYWALPAMGDANGWFYRKDWFENPELMAEFKEKAGRDLAVPKTWDEFKEVAEFFQGREIDGKTVYGAAIFTERGSEGITMGATSVLYPFGFKYETEPGHLRDGGRGQLGRRGGRARVLQGALRLLHAAGLHRQLHGAGARRLQVRPGRDDDELVRLHARHGQGRGGRRRHRLLRQSGREGRRPRRSAARASASSPTPTTWTARSPTSNGSPSPRCRRSGGRSAATPATTRC